MNNPAKAVLLLILLLFIIVTFFALTGVNVRRPEESAYKLVDKVLQLNRAINQMMRNVLFSIRTWFQEAFSR